MSTYVDIRARFLRGARECAFHCAKIRITAEPMVAVYGHHLMSTYVDIRARFLRGARERAFRCAKIRITAERTLAVCGLMFKG